MVMQAWRVAVLVLLVVVACVPASASVLGVDVGSESVRVTAPQGAAGIDVVLNEYSRRKTDNYIAHHHDDWYVGDHAKTLAARFPLRSAGAINLLVGMHAPQSSNDKADGTMAWHYTSRVTYDDARGAAHVTFRDRAHVDKASAASEAATPSSSLVHDNMTFAAEELYAMLLAYTRKIAQQHDGGKAKAAAAAATAGTSPSTTTTSMVLTLPSYASMRERRAVLDAAAMADVRVLALMPSTTAAALYYGTRRRGVDNATALHLLILDVGATHAEAGVYTLSPPSSSQSSTTTTAGGTRSTASSSSRVPLGEAFGTLTTVALLHDRHVGGRALDLCVARIMEREAMHALGIDAVLPPAVNTTTTTAATHGEDGAAATTAVLKARFALLRAANRARETLSVNRVTPYTVEGIAPGRDFHSTLTRDAYEQACGAAADAIAALAQRARDVAKTAHAVHIDVVELVGAAARTPRVIAAVAAALGGEVNRTLNMEEAAAYGAGYYAVKLSPLYRARGFRVVAPAPHAVYFTVQPPLSSTSQSNNNNNNSSNASTRRRVLVDAATARLGDVLSVTLSRSDDFALELYDGSASPRFATVHVTGVRDALTQLMDTVRAGAGNSSNSNSSSSSNSSLSNSTHLVRVQLQLSEAGVLDVTEATVVLRYHDIVTVTARGKHARNSSTTTTGSNDDSNKSNATASTAAQDEADKEATAANTTNTTTTADADAHRASDEDDDDDKDHDDGGGSDDHAATLTADNNNNSTNTSNTTTTTTTTAPPPSSSSPQRRMRRRTVSAPLRTHMSWYAPRALNATARARGRARLREMAAHEARKHARAQAKNNLEAYLFWLSYDDAHAAMMMHADAPPALTAQLRVRVAEGKQWLEEGRGSEDDCATAEYEQRLRDLQILVEELQHVVTGQTSTSSGSGGRNDDDDDDEDDKDSADASPSPPRNKKATDNDEDNDEDGDDGDL